MSVSTDAQAYLNRAHNSEMSGGVFNAEVVIPNTG